MVLCLKCNKPTTIKTMGVAVDRGGGNIQIGDEYGCTCGKTIIVCEDRLVFNPNHDFFDYYIQTEECEEQIEINK
jgi:hypothetical protein